METKKRTAGIKSLNQPDSQRLEPKPLLDACRQFVRPPTDTCITNPHPKPNAAVKK
jgi:hypothetical protein